MDIWVHCISAPNSFNIQGSTVYTKYFIHVTYDPFNHSFILILSIFFKWGKQDKERLISLPKVTQVQDEKMEFSQLRHIFWVLPAEVHFLEDPSWCLIQSRWSLLRMWAVSLSPELRIAMCYWQTISMWQAYHEIWTWVTPSFRDTIWILDNDCLGNG